MLDWASLSLCEQTYKIMSALKDPVFFMKDPYFLGDIPWPEQEHVFRKFFSNPAYRLFILLAGMRSSKTWVLSRFACFECFDVLIHDYIKKYNLSAGSPYFVTIVAAAEKQAEDTVWAHVRYKVEHSPFFQFHRPNILADTITFKTRENFFVRALGSYASTAAGRTAKAVCIDEVTGFEETAGPRGGWRIFGTLKKSTATFENDGKTYVVGSPKHPKDILMQLYEFGLRSPSTLAMRYATWELNPNKSRESLEEDFAIDPIAAMRDYGAEPRAGTDVYLHDPSIVEYNTTKPNILAMLYDFWLSKTINIKLDITPYNFVLAGDPSLKGDAFGLALGHTESQSIVIDGVLRIRPEKEINPLDVTNFILYLADMLPLRLIIFDTWNMHYEAKLKLITKGVRVDNHVVSKSDYDLWKRKCYEHKIIHPYYEPLKTELESLLTTGHKVDHPRTGSKDVSDAVMNCVYGLNVTSLAKPGLRVIEVF